MVPAGLTCVGQVSRLEAAELIVGYRFDLRTNALTAETVPNPGADRTHRFRAWRLAGDSGEPVRLRPRRKPDVRGEYLPDEE